MGSPLTESETLFSSRRLGDTRWMSQKRNGTCGLVARVESAMLLLYLPLGGLCRQTTPDFVIPWQV
jgi:hypothetical protein